MLAPECERKGCLIYRILPESGEESAKPIVSIDERSSLKQERLGGCALSTNGCLVKHEAKELLKAMVVAFNT